MSLKNMKQKSLTLTVILGLGLSIGYATGKVIQHITDPWSSAQNITRKDYIKRVVASDPKVALSMGKHLSIMNISLTSPDEIPQTEGQEVKLIAQIKLLQPISTDLNYQWILPEGVEVVQGHLEDSFANVKVGQVVQTELTVIGFSKEVAQNIVFEASVDEMGTKLGTTQIFSSRPEDTQEALAPLRQQAVDKAKEDKQKN